MGAMATFAAAILCLSLAMPRAMAQPTGAILPVFTPSGQPTLKPFITTLPKPARIPTSGYTASAPLRMVACDVVQQLHPNLPKTPLYGFGPVPTSGPVCSAASYPGPTLLNTQSVPTAIQWINNIASFPHLLPINPKLLEEYSPNYPFPTHAIPVATHVHGGEEAPSADGGPDSWFVKGAPSKATPGQTGPFYAGNVLHYNNAQRPTHLLYHDHVLAVTRHNVYAGLIGFYLITEPRPRLTTTVLASSTAYGLPPIDSEFDSDLVIQDKSFQADGQLFYSVGVRGVDPSNTWIPEFFGSFIVANGVVWPNKDVYARRYRFRIANGCQARFLNLHVDRQGSDCSQGAEGKKGCDSLPIIMVGSDGGLLPSPVRLTKGLLLSPAERADIIFDFTEVACGSKFVLSNDAQAPYPDGGVMGEQLALRGKLGPGTVLQFTVTKGCSVTAATSNTTASPKATTPYTTPASFPANLAVPPVLDSAFADIRKLLPARIPSCGAGQGAATKWGACSRQVTLGELLVDDTSVGLRINGVGYAAGVRAPGSITETPRVGTVEVWEIINLTGDTHGIHLHLVQFQLLNRQVLDLDHPECIRVLTTGNTTGTSPCNPSPCLNGARCSTTNTGAYSCTCVNGFTGATCAVPPTNTQTTTPATTGNRCSPNPCLNGGTCTTLRRYSGTSFACTCSSGFTGSTCATSVLPVPTPETNPSAAPDAIDPSAFPIYEPAALAACLASPAVISPPEPDEAGWKDTIRVPPDAVTRIVIRWMPQTTPLGALTTYNFDATAVPGYVWHCHMLDHEDNKMMRPFRMLPA